MSFTCMQIKHTHTHPLTVTWCQWGCGKTLPHQWSKIPSSKLSHSVAQAWDSQPRTYWRIPSILQSQSRCSVTASTLISSSLLVYVSEMILCTTYICSKIMSWSLFPVTSIYFKPTVIPPVTNLTVHIASITTLLAPGIWWLYDLLKLLYLPPIVGTR